MRGDGIRCRMMEVYGMMKKEVEVLLVEDDPGDVELTRTA